MFLICSFTLALEAAGSPSAGEDTEEEVAEEEVVPLDLADILRGERRVGKRTQAGQES